MVHDVAPCFVISVVEIHHYTCIQYLNERRDKPQISYQIKGSRKKLLSQSNRIVTSFLPAAVVAAVASVVELPFAELAAAGAVAAAEAAGLDFSAALNCTDQEAAGWHRGNVEARPHRLQQRGGACSAEV